MATIRRILLTWNSPGLRPSLSVTHWSTAPSLVTIQTRLAAFWATLAPIIVPGTDMGVDHEVILLESTTGALVGTEAFPGTTPTVGSNVEPNPVADATMGLIALRTGVVEGGRRIDGRLYVPRIGRNRLTVNGDLDTIGVTALADAGDALHGSGALQIWRRPRPATDPLGPRPGTSAGVVNATATSKLSTQRRRRSS